MSYAEVIYETGASSTVSFESLDELKAGLAEQHRRAVNGEPGATQDYTERTDIEPELARQASQVANRPAERIKRVFLFKTHPADLMPVGNEGVMPVDAEAVSKLVEGMTGSDGKLNMHQLTTALRDEASPVLTTRAGKFESHYKMEPAEELDLAFLDSAGGSNA